MAALAGTGPTARWAMMALVYVGYVLTEAAQTVMARDTARAASAGEVRTLVARALRQGVRGSALLTAVYLLLGRRAGAACCDSPTR